MQPPPCRRTVARVAEPVTSRRDLRLWTAAYGVSIFGDDVTLLTLPLAAHAARGRAVDIGVVAAVEAVALIASGFVVGALADRSSRRRVLLATNLVMAAVMAAVAAASIGGPSLGPLVSAAAALGVLRSLHAAAAGGIVPILAAPDDRMRYQSRLDGSQFLAAAVGPAVAGILADGGGPVWAFAIDAASFAVAAVLVAGIRGISAPADDRAREPFGRAIGAGLRAVTADRPMLAALGAICAMNTLVIAVEGQFVPYARAELGISPVGIGLLFTLGALIAVAATVVVGRARTARGDAIVAGVGVLALAVLAAGLWPSLLSAVGLYAATGIGTGVALTHFAVLRQARVGLDVLGRVMAFSRIVLVGVVPFAGLGAGRISDAAGPAAAFVFLGVVGAAVLAAVAPVLVRVRAV